MAATMNRSTVVAVFDSPSMAEAAVRDLTNLGIDRNDISLVAHHRGLDRTSSSGMSGTSTGMGTGTGSTTSTGTSGERTSDGTTVGENVAGGALFGGLGGLAIGLAALAIPGVGPVVAAGPLATTLAGAAIGAAGGGIIGALKDAGVPDEDANVYAESVRRGSTMVTVYCDPSRSDEVSRVLDRNGAQDIEETGRSYRQSGWSQFDSTAEPYSITGTSRMETTRLSPERTGRYARSYYSSGGSMAGGSMTGSGSSSEMDYSNYTTGEYRNRSWEDIEDTIRTDYLRNNPNSSWDNVKGTIRYGWEKATGKRP